MLEYTTVYTTTDIMYKIREIIPDLLFHINTKTALVKETFTIRQSILIVFLALKKQLSDSSGTSDS